MTLQEILLKGKELLLEASIENGDLDAWFLLEHILKIDRAHYYLYQKNEIDKKQEEDYLRLIKSRARHIPLQYLTGVQEFMGLTFHVNPSVLIPRQDTEVLVEEVLKKVKDGMSVLDMCTGSGCILISILHSKKKARGVGADISAQALKAAKNNAGLNHVEAEFIESNIFSHITEKFDVIVSNPPYIPSGEIPGLMEEVRDHEPIQALDGFDDGLYFYRQIIKESKHYLKSEGWLFFEVGYDQGKEVAAILEAGDYKEVQIIKDLSGLDRVVFGRDNR